MGRPNVLLICTDHCPDPLLSAFGHEAIQTPTLDRLASNGVLFKEAYTATPTCIPARRAIMTGTTARTHGDRVFQERLEMDPTLPTLPETFRNAGYQAFAVGKLHVIPKGIESGSTKSLSARRGAIIWPAERTISSFSCRIWATRGRSSPTRWGTTIT